MVVVVGWSRDEGRRRRGRRGGWGDEREVDARKLGRTSSHKRGRRGRGLSSLYSDPAWLCVCVLCVA